MNKFNFTKSDIERLPTPEKGMDTYSDTGFKGLKLYVTANGVKTFFIRKMVNGRDERFILGQYPDLSISNARDMALETRSLIAKGNNPNEKKKKDRSEQKLGDLFEEFMERYSKKEKKSWEYDQREIPKFYGGWFKYKLSEIKKTEIQRRHEKIRDDSGLYQANRCLERLRAMYNKAIEWGWEGTNPTNGIKKFKEIKRIRRLLEQERKPFLDSLNQEENFVAKSYFYMLLFTGVRKTNVLEMRWKDIDFFSKTWRIPETKNGEPHTVELIDYALKVLEAIPRTCEWVFPNPNSRSGHYEDPKKAWARIIKRSGIEGFRIHDLRHTMASWLVDSGATTEIAGNVLGHKSLESTKRYTHLSNKVSRVWMNVAMKNLIEGKNEE